MPEEVEKLKIEIEPYHAMTILSFLHEYSPEFHSNESFASLKESYDAFYKEVKSKITNSQLDDAWAQRRVNELLGKEPTIENDNN